ncbi:hypothetical protein AVXHC19_23040 [Acidovorax sacchari]
MPMPFDTQTGHDQHGRYPEAATVEDFRRNLEAVQARIAAACRRAGRDAATVRLLPVSKTRPEASLRLAHAAGCRMLGENKPQEAHRKWEAMQDLADLQWSVIGHLQTNKARLVARFAHESSCCCAPCATGCARAHPQASGWMGLSMGMSGDFEIAIEEGATVVRIGQAIFGARATPDGHYWPGEPGTEVPSS